MDQVGPANKPIDRILLFRDGKEPVVFADKLFAIFGMVWHDGALYVMNMPHLTVLRDRDGDGKADERKELFTDLGVPAGSPNDFNDHIVSGLKIGIDGYLYISVGDKGVPKATGPDGRTAQVVGGGVLAAGSTGPAWRSSPPARATISSPISTTATTSSPTTTPTTAWAGGRGSRITSTAAITAIRSTITPGRTGCCPAWPSTAAALRAAACFTVRMPGPKNTAASSSGPSGASASSARSGSCPTGSTFKVADKIDFVEHGEVDELPPARPGPVPRRQDHVHRRLVDRELGQQDREAGARLRGDLRGPDTVKTRPRGKDSDPIEAQIRQLDHPVVQRAVPSPDGPDPPAARPRCAAVTTRWRIAATDPVAKRHLVWVLDAIAGGTPEASYPLIDALKSPIARCACPGRPRSGRAGRADRASSRWSSCSRTASPSVRLQAVIALGRIGDAEADSRACCRWSAETDAFLAYSARQALRRIDDWPAAAQGLDSPDPKVRAGVLLAMEQVYDVAAVGRLAGVRRRRRSGPIDERVKALEYLAEVDRKAPPWDGKWWGTQPAQRQTAGQDDRLGRHAARAWRRSAS